jgi:hypothetical protein
MNMMQKRLSPIISQSGNSADKHFDRGLATSIWVNWIKWIIIVSEEITDHSDIFALPLLLHDLSCLPT